MLEIVIRRWELLNAFRVLVAAVCKSLQQSASSCEVVVLHGCIFIKGVRFDSACVFEASVTAELAFDAYRCDVERKIQVNFIELAAVLRQAKYGDSLHMSCVAIHPGPDTLAIRVDHCDGTYHSKTCTVLISEDTSVMMPVDPDPDTSVVFHGSAAEIARFFREAADHRYTLFTLEVANGQRKDAPPVVILRVTGAKGADGEAHEGGYPNGDLFVVEPAHSDRRAKFHLPIECAQRLFWATSLVCPDTVKAVLTMEPAGFLRVKVPTFYGSVNQYAVPAQTDDLFDSLVNNIVAATPLPETQQKEQAGPPAQKRTRVFSRVSGNKSN